MSSAKTNPLKYFQIHTDGKQPTGIEQVGTQQFSSGKGIYRAAQVPSNLPQKPYSGMIYHDDQFKLNVFRQTDSQGREIKSRRLYEIYDRQVPLFPQDGRTSHIKQMNFYPTFITECTLVDQDYLKSLFFTQKVNKEGYYKYFVKRNGVYHVETVDDEIPVDDIKRFPIWGLSIQCPWQIILLKAWIKQKGGLDQVKRAQPFEFLNTFGLPAYKVFNFKKELKFIAEERIAQEKKNKKLQQFKLNKDNLIIIGKSRNSSKLSEMGLVQDRAAYLITPADKKGLEAQVFRVESTIPHKWVGQLSVVADKQMNNKYDTRKYNLSLQNSFLIKRNDLLELFNKFYVASNRHPFASSSTYINYPLQSTKSHQIEFTVHQGGPASIVVQLPRELRVDQGAGKIRYPKIKYFLVKQNDPNFHSKSQIRSKLQLKSKINLQQQEFVTTEKDKYSYYDIQYGLGYHKSINQFIGLQPGNYILHCKVEKKQKPYIFQLIFNSSAEIRNLREVNLTQPQKNLLFNSCFYSLGLTHGTQVAMNDHKYAESIKIGNLFYEIGYGFIVITTMKTANHHLAMRVFPKRLRQAGYALKCGLDQKREVNQGQDENSSDKSLVYVSQKGQPEIIVLRMIKKIPMEQRFPPKGTVEFYRVTD